MNQPMPKDVQKWSETRKKGKWNFVLVNGVVCWGLPMFSIMTFIVNRRPDRPLTGGAIALSAAIWGLGGFCFGLVIWALSERKYQKFLASQNPGAEP